MSSLTEEIDRYVAAACQHRSATNSGDSDKANRAHDDLVESLLRIRSLCNGTVIPLESVLSHKDAGVRCWAATHLIWELPERAAKILNDTVDEGGFTGFDARMVLQEWENGRLQPPWNWNQEID